MNQGKLEVDKQEMARVTIDILGISKLKWTGMGEFYSDDHYIYYCGQKSLRRNTVAIMVNKRVRNAVLLLLSRFSHVRLCATPETAAHQAPPSLGFSRQEYWSELPFLKCNTWMQSQKRQNDLCSFPRQTIQYHGNPSLCPNQ